MSEKFLYIFNHQAKSPTVTGNLPGQKKLGGWRQYQSHTRLLTVEEAKESAKAMLKDCLSSFGGVYNQAPDSPVKHRVRVRKVEVIEDLLIE